MRDTALDRFESSEPAAESATVYTRFAMARMPGSAAPVGLIVAGTMLATMGLVFALAESGAISTSERMLTLLTTASELGWSAGMMTLGGSTLVGLGIVARTLVATGRSLLGEVVDLPDPTPLIEELDVQQQKLHVNLVSVQNSMTRAVQESFHALREQLLAIESRIYHVENQLNENLGNPDESEKQREQALWNLTSGLDKFGKELEAKIEERLTKFEGGLSEELAESVSGLFETIIGRVNKQSEQREARERARLTAEREAAEQAKRAASAASPAATAPVIGEIDSLGMFDELDEHGMPREQKPAAAPQPAAPQQPTGQAQAKPKLDLATPGSNEPSGPLPAAQPDLPAEPSSPSSAFNPYEE